MGLGDVIEAPLFDEKEVILPFEVITGEASSVLAPGHIAFVPRGTAHTIRKVGEGVGRVVSIHTPGGVEHFFREIGTPARADDFMSVPPLTHTPEQLAGICARHKMSMLD